MNNNLKSSHRSFCVTDTTIRTSDASKSEQKSQGIPESHRITQYGCVHLAVSLFAVFIEKVIEG